MLGQSPSALLFRLHIHRTHLQQTPKEISQSSLVFDCPVFAIKYKCYLASFSANICIDSPIILCPIRLGSLLRLPAVRLHHQQKFLKIVDSPVEGVNVTKQLANGEKLHLFPNTGHPTSESTLNHLKRRSSALENSQNSFALAKRAVAIVKSGMVIGLGTGGTSLVIKELGKLIGEGKPFQMFFWLKDIVAVGANYHSRLLAKQFGLRTVDLNDVDNIDIVFDGVDEVDFTKTWMEAARTVQKVVCSMANVCIILAEHAKVVHQLRSKFPVTVEVLPLATSPVSRRLIALGGVPEIRSALRKDGPVITDLGNMIIYVSFPEWDTEPS
ncbi:hypothetical protein RGQ29_024633 [Quercus rubra]|uniref:ribose-5-phosphate isomerase n=1 Tax=Quercus rubra TaxID=3512 RepID=A0AAN7EVT3_QUERU|nr:hypothetical protein RGQ29_024633 [Quercus rubra]